LCTFWVTNHNYIFDKEFGKSFFFEEKVISYGIKKGKLDSHFHGNDKKKRGNDLREVEEITSPYYEITTDDISLV